MRIISKRNAISESVELIMAKAKYQKVVFCIDETSDTKTIEAIINRLKNKVIAFKYYYNNQTVSEFFNMVNNGVRVVVYNVAIKHFYKLQNDNKFVLNIFLPQENFMLPYMANSESLYGDNVLVCDETVKDNLSILFVYQLGLYKVWTQLLQQSSVDVSAFKMMDDIANNNNQFYVKLCNIVEVLKNEIDNGYKDVEIDQLPYYVYMQTCSVLKLFESLNSGQEQYVDFYKQGLTHTDIDKAHNLIAKHNIVDLIKLNNLNLIKLTVVILNRLKILIKKYFNFKNIKLDKINKLIKNQAKYLNIDKLLYISFIFNTI